MLTKETLSRHKMQVSKINPDYDLQCSRTSEDIGATNANTNGSFVPLA